MNFFKSFFWVQENQSLQLIIIKALNFVEMLATWVRRQLGRRTRRLRFVKGLYKVPEVWSSQ
jgi:hypothetical protein